MADPTKDDTNASTNAEGADSRIDAIERRLDQVIKDQGRLESGQKRAGSWGPAIVSSLLAVALAFGIQEWIQQWRDQTDYELKVSAKCFVGRAVLAGQDQDVGILRLMIRNLGRKPLVNVSVYVTVADAEIIDVREGEIVTEDKPLKSTITRTTTLAPNSQAAWYFRFTGFGGEDPTLVRPKIIVNSDNSVRMWEEFPAPAVGDWIEWSSPTQREVVVEKR